MSLPQFIKIERRMKQSLFGMWLILCILTLNLLIFITLPLHIGQKVIFLEKTDLMLCFSFFRVESSILSRLLRSNKGFRKLFVVTNSCCLNLS